MNNNIEFAKIIDEDVPSIQGLAYENGGNKFFNLKNFGHWYLSNPTKSNSMWKVSLDDRVEGYATTNNFVYNINNKENLVALPQNVLTSQKIRGKGIFGKLYNLTEAENLNTNKVDFFLTSTGGMSTPIFLNKFGYRRAVCPDVLAILPTPFKLFAVPNYTVLDNLDKIQFDEIYIFENSRKKTIEYYKWRYSNCDKNVLKILEITDVGKKIGYAFLIVQKKRGINTLILADLLCGDPKAVTSIIDACQVFTSKNFYLVLLMFKLKNNDGKRRFQLSFKNKFNFLVKGKTENGTEWLSQLPINYFLGDLDYFW